MLATQMDAWSRSTQRVDDKFLKHNPVTRETLGLNLSVGSTDESSSVFAV